MPPLVRVVHPAPAIAVVVLSAALAAIMSAQAGHAVIDARVLLTTLAVLGSQVATGATNDWADRDRDAVVQPTKPIPARDVTPRGALAVAGLGVGVQVLASIPLGIGPLILGLAALASAVAYNLWLSRTVLSVLPYLVSFGLLPLWVAAGVGVPFERVAAAPLLVGPFAAAAHLANALRDFEADRRIGSRSLVQRLGRRSAFGLAWGLAMAVGVAVGATFLLGGRLQPPTAALGLIGLASVAQGIVGPQRLWAGMLVAAVCWTAAWALGSSPTV